MVPQGEWGDRVLKAFRQEWEANGGTIVGVEHVDKPVALAQQVADLVQLRKRRRPRACKAQSTSRAIVRTWSSSSWPPHRNRPSRSSRR
jgi:uncharacterized protein